MSQHVPPSKEQADELFGRILKGLTPDIRDAGNMLADLGMPTTPYTAMMTAVALRVLLRATVAETLKHVPDLIPAAFPPESTAQGDTRAE